MISPALVLQALSGVSSIATLDGWVRGLTNARSIKATNERIHNIVVAMDGRMHRIESQLEQIDVRIFREISSHGTPAADVAVTQFERGLSDIGHAVIREKAIRIPDDLQASIDREPRRFLNHIHDVREKIAHDLLADPHLVACPFVEEGLQKIGFANVGLMEALGVPFRPLLTDRGRAVELSPQIEKLESVPVSNLDAAMRGKEILPQKTLNPTISPEFVTLAQLAAKLEIAPHVLRFWESKFDCISPIVRAGGRRYYNYQDVEIITAVLHHLHVEGLTIKGVQKIVRGSGVDEMVRLSKP